jgi:hypothetical protein
VLEVELAHLQSAGFADPASAVEQETDKCFVAAVVELFAVARLE